MTDQPPSNPRSSSLFPGLALIWLSVCVVLIAVTFPNILSGMGWGPDDQLRQVQLRDWLAGQSWTDSHQYRIGDPGSAPMHWTRLIELPLAAVLWALKPLIGPAAAETAAMVVVPLITLALVMLLVAKITRQIFDQRTAWLAAALTATAVPVIAQLRPMRIDHHGWQIVLALAALWTLFWPTQRRGGLAMGAALALWLSISLEGLPLSIGFIGLLVWRWIRNSEEGPRLFWTLVSFLGASIALFWINHGHFELWRSYCDAVSTGHLLACLAGAAVLLPAIHFKPAAVSIRIAALGIAGIAGIAVLYWFNPDCLGSAFGRLDPVVRDYWLVNVREGLPLWSQPWTENVTIFGGAILVGLGGLFVLLRYHAETIDKDRFFVIAYALLWAVIVSIFVQRAAATAAVFALPFMAWTVEHVFAKARALEKPVVRIAATVAVVFLILPGPLFLAAVNTVSGPDKTAVTSSEQQPASGPACGSAASLAKLNALPPTTIMAPFDFGPAILVQTPHKVLATSHHRNDAAMRDQILAFSSVPNEARDILTFRNIRYIIACPDVAELGIYTARNPGGLWDQLAKGQKPSWLLPVHLRDSNLLVWRVVPKQ